MRNEQAARAARYSQVSPGLQRLLIAPGRPMAPENVHLGDAFDTAGRQQQVPAHGQLDPKLEIVAIGRKLGIAEYSLKRHTAVGRTREYVNLVRFVAARGNGVAVQNRSVITAELSAG